MVTASTQPIWLKVASVTGRAPASGSDDPKLKPKSKPKPWNPTIGCGALQPKPKPKPKPLNPFSNPTSGWRNDMSCIILTGHLESLQYNPSSAIPALACCLGPDRFCNRMIQI